MLLRRKELNSSNANTIKKTGSHYTPSSLANFVAQGILDNISPEIPKKRLRILDPAVGDGELLLAISAELIKREFMNFELFGFDTDPHAVEIANERILCVYPEKRVNLVVEDFLDYVIKYYKYNDLFKESIYEPFDVIITNPPYVRTQVMGAERSKKLAKFYDLSGRVDLYHAFVKALGYVLRENGVAGIIVSNRFMYIKSGERIREHIICSYEIMELWDFGDTKLFEAAVLPAVMVLKKISNPQSHNSRFTTIYSQSNLSDSIPPETNVFSAIQSDISEFLLNNQVYRIRRGILDCDGSSRNVWRLSEIESNNWLQAVRRNTVSTFGQIGRVRVGIKTTADSIFIRDDWDYLGEDIPEDKLLRPLINHNFAGQYRAKDVSLQLKVLYPYLSLKGKRTLADINEYPKAHKYLLKFKAALERRKYLSEAGRAWFELWVPQQPADWVLPKIIFWDIAKEPCFWIDLSGAIVNGDCYWFTLNESDNIDLLLLCLAISNSRFIEKFYDLKFNNKLYAGRRRFMSQYVKEVPIPTPTSNRALKIIYNTRKIIQSENDSLVRGLRTSNEELISAIFGVGL